MLTSSTHQVLVALYFTTAACKIHMRQGWWFNSMTEFLYHWIIGCRKFVEKIIISKNFWPKMQNLGFWQPPLWGRHPVLSILTRKFTPPRVQNQKFDAGSVWQNLVLINLIEEYGTPAVQLYRVYIQPILLCGSQTWTLTRALEDRITAFHNICLRCIFQIWYTDHVTNADVQLRVGSLPHLPSPIQTRRLRFFGHIARMGSTQDTFRALHTSIHRFPKDWKCRPGYPRHTWLRTIKADLQPLNHGLRLAEDQGWWRQLMEMVRLQSRARLWWWWWWFWGRLGAELIFWAPCRNLQLCVWILSEIWSVRQKIATATFCSA